MDVLFSFSSPLLLTNETIIELLNAIQRHFFSKNKSLDPVKGSRLSARVRPPGLEPGTKRL